MTLGLLEFSRSWHAGNVPTSILGRPWGKNPRREERARRKLPPALFEPPAAPLAFPYEILRKRRPQPRRIRPGPKARLPAALFEAPPAPPAFAAETLRRPRREDRRPARGRIDRLPPWLLALPPPPLLVQPLSADRTERPRVRGRRRARLPVALIPAPAAPPVFPFEVLRPPTRKLARRIGPRLSDFPSALIPAPAPPAVFSPIFIRRRRAPTRAGRFYLKVAPGKGQPALPAVAPSFPIPLLTPPRPRAYDHRRFYLKVSAGKGPVTGVGPPPAIDISPLLRRRRIEHVERRVKGSDVVSVIPLPSLMLGGPFDPDIFRKRRTRTYRDHRRFYLTVRHPAALRTVPVTALDHLFSSRRKYKVLQVDIRRKPRIPVTIYATDPPPAPSEPFSVELLSRRRKPGRRPDRFRRRLNEHIVKKTVQADVDIAIWLWDGFEIGVSGKGPRGGRGRRKAGRKPNIIAKMRAKDRATQEMIDLIRKKMQDME